MPHVLGANLQYRNGNFTAAVNGFYSVRTDGGAVTVTLPANPGQGAVVNVQWLRGYNNLTFVSQNGQIYINGSPWGDSNAATQVINNRWVGSTFTLCYDGTNWIMGIPASDNDAGYNFRSGVNLVAGHYYHVSYLNDGFSGHIQAKRTDRAVVQNFSFNAQYNVTGGIGYGRGTTFGHLEYGGKVFDYMAIGSNRAYSIWARALVSGTFDISGFLQRFNGQDAYSVFNSGWMDDNGTGVGTGYGGWNVG